MQWNIMKGVLLAWVPSFLAKSNERSARFPQIPRFISGWEGVFAGSLYGDSRTIWFTQSTKTEFEWWRLLIKSGVHFIGERGLKGLDPEIIEAYLKKLKKRKTS
jgi:hypothetical protein